MDREVRDETLLAAKHIDDGPGPSLHLILYLTLDLINARTNFYHLI